MEKVTATIVAKSGKLPSTQVSGSGRGTFSSMTPDQRKHMIEEAAYYRAESRGFRNGDPLQDWLEAEAAIERMMSGTSH